mmetsp:Transcript_34137/g.80455  ORF Transcript_34137/g.80455 Transcript_34137/m.80455 type:complete len:206 (+) Transcript_34137:2398-3015(+)
MCEGAKGARRRDIAVAASQAEPANSGCARQAARLSNAPQLIARTAWAWMRTRAASAAATCVTSAGMCTSFASAGVHTSAASTSIMSPCCSASAARSESPVFAYAAMIDAASACASTASLLSASRHCRRPSAETLSGRASESRCSASMSGVAAPCCARVPEDLFLAEGIVGCARRELRERASARAESAPRENAPRESTRADKREPK